MDIFLLKWINLSEIRFPGRLTVDVSFVSGSVILTVLEVIPG